MNYIGSKHSLLPFIQRVFNSVCDGDVRTVCDIFAGTGAVGRCFKTLGYRVLANDLQYYSFALNKAYLEINHQPRFNKLRRVYSKELERTRGAAMSPVAEALAIVNQLEGFRGFITKNYGPAADRFYYTDENARRADAVRQALEDWRREGLISSNEFFYLLSSLIEAVDAVANTASVYGAFLKKFKASALKPFDMKPLRLTNHVTQCRAFCEDANQLIDRIECDVLYLDPPYNHRQYGANYHVLETLAAYDQPELKGVTGMREYARSLYCRQESAAETLANLVGKARTRHILMSYNDEGVLSLDEVRRILGSRGRVTRFTEKYGRFKADNGREYKRDKTVEFIHHVKC